MCSITPEADKSHLLTLGFQRFAACREDAHP